MESNDISPASAGSTPPIHFLDLKKKSTALGSVVSKSSNINYILAQNCDTGGVESTDAL